MSLGSDCTVEYYDSAVDATVNSLASTFANLIVGAGKTHKFTAGNKVTINKAFVSNGTAENRAILLSTSNGTEWELELNASTGLSLLYNTVDVKDSDASSGKAIQARGSINRGNNTNWFFIKALDLEKQEIDSIDWGTQVNGNWEKIEGIAKWYISPISLNMLTNKADSIEQGTWQIGLDNTYPYSGYLYNASNNNGDSFSLKFRCLEGMYTLRFQTAKNESFGIVDIKIDDVEKGSEDLYASSTDKSFVKEIASLELTQGEHTLTFVVDGKNASSIGYYFYISEVALSASSVSFSLNKPDIGLIPWGDQVNENWESIEEIPESIPAPIQWNMLSRKADSIAQGTWDISLNNTYPYSGCYYNTSHANGDEFTCCFHCPAGIYKLYLNAPKDSDRGIVSIEIDGIEQDSIDLYAASAEKSNIIEITGIELEGKDHTLTLRIEGKNASSSDYYFYGSGISLQATSVSAVSLNIPEISSTEWGEAVNENWDTIEEMPNTIGATLAINMLTNEPSAIQQGTWETTIDSTYPYSGYLSNTSNSNGDSWSITIQCPAGVYSLRFHAPKGNDRGILDIKIDNIAKGSEDLYSSTSNKGFVKEIPYLELEEGMHTITFVVDGKNANSSDYYFYCSGISLQRMD